MKIAITGSTGLIGTELVNTFLEKENEVIRIIRDPFYQEKQDQIKLALWDPEKKSIDRDALESLDILIHLAGENVSEHRWTQEQKNKIWKSRVEGSTFLYNELTALQTPPKLLLAASAMGYYGNRNSNQTMDETSSRGNDFLSHLVSAWEKTTEVLKILPVRIIHMRFGLVLSTKGGALAKMLPVFKLGFGGKIGHGRQIMSWISLEEISHIIFHLIQHEELNGPVNIVSPYPISNAEFTKILGMVLHRPAFFSIPDFIIKILWGELGEALLLTGAKILPKKLLQSGYNFKYPHLKEALEHLL